MARCIEVKNCRILSMRKKRMVMTGGSDFHGEHKSYPKLGNEALSDRKHFPHALNSDFKRTSLLSRSFFGLYRRSVGVHHHGVYLPHDDDVMMMAAWRAFCPCCCGCVSMVATPKPMMPYLAAFARVPTSTFPTAVAMMGMVRMISHRCWNQGGWSIIRCVMGWRYMLR